MSDRRPPFSCMRRREEMSLFAPTRAFGRGMGGIEAGRLRGLRGVKMIPLTRRVLALKAPSMVVIEAYRRTAAKRRFSLAALEVADARGDRRSIVEGRSGELARDLTRDGLVASLPDLAPDGRDRGRWRVGPSALAALAASAALAATSAVFRPRKGRIRRGWSLLSFDA